jgi:hypothetical protein
MTDLRVCEPAQVEERHRTSANAHSLVWVCSCPKLAPECPRRERLALAFAEQEREVTEANAMLIDRYAATYRDPLLESVTRGAANFIRLQRATPGGEREEGSGR